MHVFCKYFALDHIQTEVSRATTAAAIAASQAATNMTTNSGGAEKIPRSIEAAVS